MNKLLVVTDELLKIFSFQVMLEFLNDLKDNQLNELMLI